MEMAKLHQNHTLNSSWNVADPGQHTEDDLVNSWLLTSNPSAVIALVVGYLAFVLYLGPRLMERRKPYDLKAVMMVYNVIQVVYNTTLLVTYLSKEGVISYMINHHCYPLDSRTNPLRIELCTSMWYFTVLKILDLLDTVFFVLRKKQGHVSFLHVYHHSAAVILCFGALKYNRGEQVVWVGIVNGTVHIVMYSYYFLAALGEHVRRYLWWKRYITIMQIAQFVFFIAYYAYLSMSNCNLPKIVNYAACSQAFIFLCLFINFYINCYTKNKPVQMTKDKDQ